MIDFKEVEKRKDIKIHTFFEIQEEGSSTTKGKKSKKYDYYICDNCKNKIPITKNKEEAIGGKIKVKVNYVQEIELVLCNKCLKDSIKQINHNYEISI